MKKKEITDFIVSISLMIMSICIIVLGYFEVTDLKLILSIAFGFYAVIKLTQFIIIRKEKDVQSLFTGIISLGACLAITCFDLKMKYIILTILIWMGLMCLIKLKKADFYHDRGNKMWILRIFMLFVFIVSALLTGLNLTHESDIQILVIGSFLLLNSILEAIDPLVLYIVGVSNENNQ